MLDKTLVIPARTSTLESDVCNTGRVDFGWHVCGSGKTRMVASKIRVIVASNKIWVVRTRAG